ncbi:MULTISPECIES: outer membrane beta-barrel protein [Pseudoalteromonas]|uniref:outer membrane beta-barrel protein n=1 Tax=Pseudoalteromonas TaxID=53246 RepID=UPI000C7B483D|nr:MULTISPECIES: outer membrane beta-barrel protein [Pseudoalteromonas]AUJ71088.1 hypothetical protein PNC201_14170 [Pseudoalteromonas sp. NC201]MBR8843823.1 outer membrane beta-barrel protein [Pseudoalteromonas sp. JC3]MCF7512145.1 porin family protein [Pseudoalteromonas sp. L7]MCF7524641.1 porin family protein [Pseudoalteromonas sp. L23]MCX2766680.1 outer membrane beta-barrel protein [Pseudoalteromonas sp. B530]
MKKQLFGLAVLSLPMYAKADIAIFSEVLFGKANNEFYAEQESDLGYRRASSANSDSWGLRLGVGLTDHLALEIAQHFHGESLAEYSVHVSNTLSGIYQNPYDYSYRVRFPIDTESLRLGIKGEIEVSTNINANIRVGMAHWQYKDVIPAQLVPTGSTSSGDSGNDIYTSIGVEYRLTDNLYVGLEYSLLNIKESKEYDYTGVVQYEHNLHDISMLLGWAF